MKEWDLYYEKPISLFEFLSDNIIHIPYLISIISKRPGRILEIGCGTASHSILLSYFLRNCEFTCVDNNPKVIENAKINVYKFNGRNIILMKNDAFMLDFEPNSFDVSISQGFFEHFTDEEIKLLLKQQLRVARKVIFSVPSDKYVESNDCLGNERFLSLKKWKNIILQLNEAKELKIKVTYYNSYTEIRTRLERFKIFIKKYPFFKSISKSFLEPLQIKIEVDSCDSRKI